MNLAKLLALLKRKPKPRPIYVGDTIVGYDDGLPNSVKIDRNKLIEGIIGESLTAAHFTALRGVGKVHYSRDNSYHATLDIYADVGIAAWYSACAGVNIGGAYLRIRDRLPYWIDNVYTCYWAEIAQARATSDFAIWKTVAGGGGQLAAEAVDLTADANVPIGLFATGTTIKGARCETYPPNDWFNHPSVPPPSDDIKISVTDTSIASGAVGEANISMRYTPSAYWGAVNYWSNEWVLHETLLVKPPASPSPEPLAYFEVPIEFFDLPEFDEYGNINITRRFYGVKMPEEIVTIEKPIPNRWLEQKVNVLKAKGWTTEEIKAFMPEAFPVERINRLAVTWSALIPTDNKGKPKDAVAIVRVFGGSPEYVHPIEKRIQAIKEMRGVRQLSREEAIDLALKMDDKLHIHDLVPCTKHDLGGKCYREYRDWRIYTVGDKPEHADTDIRKHYVKESKGW